MNLLPHIEIETKPEPTASVIWLHGLGANGHDFEPIVKELGLENSPGVRFIFPHAPSIPVTINNGYVMPAWYDILDMSIDRKVDATQLRQSAQQIVKFINHEIERGIPANKILIAGFSQGGAVALEVALSYPQRLAGLMALSTYFATQDSIELTNENQDTPILVCHGDYDPVVPVQLGAGIAETLKAKNYRVEFLRYPMEHAVCPQQIQAIATWLKKVLQLT
ncbi:alpha/beta hydrolase [Aliikangiella sp. IMCC44653]